ncbi:unnamed protein product [Symbiodinium pilosum]|uniref:Uncharacterized protein n=1 Tax=Symbiodinium pilosum TaxID=2952 RepID=A0A812T0F3_SYMPI|nr:unnamed protein product [Symbiodinium pilosum]
MHYSRLARKAAALVRTVNHVAPQSQQMTASSDEEMRLRLLASLPRSWLSTTGPVVRLPVATAADNCCLEKRSRN